MPMAKSPNYKRSSIKCISQSQSMAAEITESHPHQLPTIFYHHLPNFNLPIVSILKARFRILDPIDSSESNQSFLAAHAQSVRVLLCAGPSPVNADIIQQLPALECVVGSSSGVDHIDLLECRRRGISVTNAGDAFSEDVADYAVALLIDVLRKISAADQYVRAGLWSLKGEYHPGSKVGGKRIGIVGLGSIGSLVAKRLEAFGCSIAYNSRKKRPSLSYPFYSNVHDLAANSDVLIVCCALTDETHHVINKDVMTVLGKNGIIINVGCGALIDEKELVQFLVKGELGGVGLDVFENEPIVPKELFELDNVVLSPHRAVLTPESFVAMQDLVIANLEAFFCNKPLHSAINFE